MIIISVQKKKKNSVVLQPDVSSAAVTENCLLLLLLHLGAFHESRWLACVNLQNSKAGGGFLLLFLFLHMLLG